MSQPASPLHPPLSPLVTFIVSQCAGFPEDLVGLGSTPPGGARRPLQNFVAPATKFCRDARLAPALTTDARWSAFHDAGGSTKRSRGGARAVHPQAAGGRSAPSGRSGPPAVPAGSSLTNRTRSRTIGALPPSAAAATEGPAFARATARQGQPPSRSRGTTTWQAGRAPDRPPTGTGDRQPPDALGCADRARLCWRWRVGSG